MEESGGYCEFFSNHLRALSLGFGIISQESKNPHTLVFELDRPEKPARLSSNGELLDAFGTKYRQDSLGLRQEQALLRFYREVSKELYPLQCVMHSHLHVDSTEGFCTELEYHLTCKDSSNNDDGEGKSLDHVVFKFSHRSSKSLNRSLD